MQLYRKTILATAGLALTATLVSSLSVPTSTAGYSLIGGSLGLGQRDFQVYNNFTDGSANNNNTPHANFPGASGATMAIWKGQLEWGSVPVAGNGLGDGLSSNPVLGSGGANFDNTYQGEVTSVGNSNSNRHSELSGAGGSTLAFTQTPISDGWIIRYYSSWSWADGPGGVSGVDLQGVACHEVGHSIGLGHSSASGATMRASITGTGTAQRSINSDDIAGVQAVYGAISANKVEITGISGTFAIGSTLTINGDNFDTTGNQVWFTSTGSGGQAAKVTGVSSTGGGTQIQVTIPAGVESGDVLVQRNGSGHAALSNAWPLSIGGLAGDPPSITSVNPTSGPAGGFDEVIITGDGFTGVHTVQFDGNDALAFSVDSGTQITATTPPGTFFANVDVLVADPEGSFTMPNGYTYSFDPLPSVDTISPATGTILGGTPIVITGTSVVGVTGVTIDGVPATEVEIIDEGKLSAVTPEGSIGVVDVVVTNTTGSDTLSGGFTYIDTGSFEDIGPGVGGSFGPPVLTGFGDLTPGSPTGFTLFADGGWSGVAATFYAGLASNPVPFKGGLFYPIPLLIQIPLSADAFGNVELAGAIPLGTPPGTEIVMQIWMFDISAPFLAGGSNGLKATTP